MQESTLTTIIKISKILDKQEHKFYNGLDGRDQILGFSLEPTTQQLFSLALIQFDIKLNSQPYG
jgi:hypothetical protein